MTPFILLKSQADLILVTNQKSPSKVCGRMCQREQDSSGATSTHLAKNQDPLHCNPLISLIKITRSSSFSEKYPEINFF